MLSLKNNDLTQSNETKADENEGFSKCEADDDEDDEENDENDEALGDDDTANLDDDDLDDVMLDNRLKNTNEDNGSIYSADISDKEGENEEVPIKKNSEDVEETSIKPAKMKIKKTRAISDSNKLEKKLNNSNMKAITASTTYAKSYTKTPYVNIM